MKARKVKGLDPDASFGDNVRRIVETRVDELCSFAPAVLDPSEVKALHDMRIAAKRLRYILELAEPAFGRAAAAGAKEAKTLQTLLGDIHDCDEMLPRVRAHAERLRAEDAAAVRAAAARDVGLRPELLRDAPNRRRYRGLEALATYLTARRELLYGEFVEHWAKLEGKGFPEKLIRGLAEPAGVG
jgi:CHAD domain-containing protein